MMIFFENIIRLLANLTLLLLLASCFNKSNDNSDLYDHPGTIVKTPPYFEKRADPQNKGGYNNPYTLKKNHYYSGEDYYVPPASYDNNVNDNYGNIPRSGWDRMY